MGSMMTGLYVGLSGLQTSSNSLNTTANNLTNTNTAGYVRQMVINKDFGYNDVTTTSGVNKGQSGLGVQVATISHTRDIFLDKAYRKELGRKNFYDNIYDGIYSIETQFGNSEGIEGIGYQSALTDLREAINKVAEAPGEKVTRSAMVQSAVEFLDKSKLVYQGLAKYQTNVDEEVVRTVNRINEIGESIRDLNNRISRIEAGKIEGANDLRDQRDLLLDELAGYGKIKYSEDNRGVIEVSFEGVHFADELSVNHIGFRNIENSNFVEPIWKEMGDQPVYNLAAGASTEESTDIGGLKGLLMTRGTITPTVADMTAPDPDDYPAGVNDEAYIDALDRYTKYNECRNTSVIVNTLANFDKLISSIVTGINDILCPETTYTAADGTTYKILDKENAPVTEDGIYGIELFTRNYTDRYTEMTIDGKSMLVRNDTNDFGQLSYYSVNNVEVNNEIQKDYSKMPLSTLNGADDYPSAQELLKLFDAETLRYNDGIDDLNYEEFLEAMINYNANIGKIYYSMAEGESNLASALDSRRQEIMGVSSDEELGNMIKYQQAYNAASRYINVVSDMIETLINRTGA